MSWRFCLVIKYIHMNLDMGFGFGFCFCFVGIYKTDVGAQT